LISIKNALINMSNRKNKSFGEIINNALLSSINALLLILGVVTIFMIITTIIEIHFNFDISGILEISQGLRNVSLMDIPLKTKTILSTMIISFGGLSVHTQIISILSDTNIKYFPFLIARILHGIISGILVYLVF